jgi:hypothetical protein
MTAALRTRLLVTIAAVATGLAPAACSNGSGSSGNAAEDLGAGTIDANDVLSDADLTGAQGVTATQVQSFLASKGSALAAYVDPQSGRTAADLIVSLSLAAHVSPVYMLSRIEGESGLVTSGSLAYLDSSTGCGCPDSQVCNPANSGFYNQVSCAATTVRGYLDSLASGGSTVSGWRVGAPKDTLDACTVTPSNAATAAMYTYTPWVGQYSTSSCGRAGIGGSSLLAMLFQKFAPAFPGASSGGNCSASQSSAPGIASLALANVGQGACTTNTLGGGSFDSSCAGNGGQPEYWCADFARWVWAAAGASDTSQLTPAAGSFYVYGQNHGTLSSVPAVGDAVVFDYKGGGVADHVAIVSRVNGDGTIETVSGDWGGQSGGEAQFASTSHVALNTPAYPGVVGSSPGVIGMTISGFIAPAGVASCVPAAAPQYVAVVSTPDGMGYWEAKGDGTVVAHGTAGSYGSVSGPLNAPVVGMATTSDGKGYWLVAADGGLFSFGDAAFYGSMGGHALNAPVVGMAATPDGRGYWLVAADGGLFSFGNAAFYGSMGGKGLNAPVVGMASTADGKGYWLAAADGGLFTFGDAAFYGSMGGKKLAAPVVGVAASPTGKGYWMVGADGGLFSFGDAAFYGSATSLPHAPMVGMASDRGGYWLLAGDGTIYPFGNAPTPGSGPYVGIAPTPGGGGYWEAGADGSVYAFGDAGWYGSMARMPLNAAVVGIAATPDGKGYWLAGADGGVYTLGDAEFHGSMGGQHLNAPVVGIAATPSGHGYWLAAGDGGLFSFGDAGFHGSMGGQHLNAPVVGIAATPSGGGYWMVAGDGGLFAFGDAGFHGSMGGKSLDAPMVGIAATSSGQGYWMVARDGGLFSFGDAPFAGSAANLGHAPVTGVASDGGAGYWMLASDGAIYSFGGAGYHGGAN